jgi:hypothetical protein
VYVYAKTKTTHGEKAVLYSVLAFSALHMTYHSLASLHCIHHIQTTQQMKHFTTVKHQNDQLPPHRSTIAIDFNKDISSNSLGSTTQLSHFLSLSLSLLFRVIIIIIIISALSVPFVAQQQQH